ncbi:MAG TPA: ankyrin repeat domain-containing protein, partial [Alphaproteobacteria bacterium]|nr:ankyrin repeat domain-containing protein [Alphaproteobacteria bacterium]
KAEEGWTPLHDAARGGHKEIADLLRKHGAK